MIATVKNLIQIIQRLGQYDCLCLSEQVAVLCVVVVDTRKHRACNCNNGTRVMNNMAIEIVTRVVDTRYELRKRGQKGSLKE